MNILITLTLLAMVMAETKEPPKDKDIHPKSGVKIQPKKPPSNHVSSSTAGPVNDPSKTEPNSNHLWRHNPGSQYTEQIANNIQSVVLRPHISRTRIAKAHTRGIDPYFNKGYFEPFEKRPRPVTLVAFRKNGLIPRQNIEVQALNKLEVAEMQSPYNNVGSFWQEDIGQP